MPVTSLDAWADATLAPDDRIAVLKIDAEGFDGSVIAGATKLLRARRVDSFIFERPLRYPVILPTEERLSSDKDTFRYLVDLGYSCYLPATNHRKTILLSHTKFTIDVLNSMNRQCRPRNVACALSGSPLERAFLATSAAHAIYVHNGLASDIKNVSATESLRRILLRR